MPLVILCTAYFIISYANFSWINSQNFFDDLLRQPHDFEKDVITLARAPLLKSLEYILYLYKKEERENVIKETHRLIYLWGKVNQTRMRKDFSSYIDRQTTNKYLVRASLNPHS